MFHWICPECGREIAPSVRACQACDPNAVAPAVVEPVRSQSFAEALPAPPPLPPPPENLAVVEWAPEPVVPAPLGPPNEAALAEPLANENESETKPAAESRAHEEASIVSGTELLAEPSRHVEGLPLTATREPQVAAPVAAEPEPVVGSSLPFEVVPVVPERAGAQAAPADTAPFVEPATETEPVVAAAIPAGPPVSGPEPVAEPIRYAEAAVVTEPEPLLIAAPHVEPVPAVSEPEPVAEPIRYAEAAPVAEPAQVVAPVVSQGIASELEPGHATRQVDVAPAAPQPVHIEAAVPELALEAPIKLHEVPDPLFALAVEIRAVQAARAAASAAPQEAASRESAGLLELAEAVGPSPVQNSQPVEPSVPAEQPAPVEPAALFEAPAAVDHAAPLGSPSQAPENKPTEAAVPAVETASPVALLAPPQPEKTLILAPAALAPAALAPAALASAALAPMSLPEADGPTLPYAPMQDYTPATSRSILPVPPRRQILATDSGPRITLPGPTLPPELSRLQEANVVTVIGEQTAQRTKEAFPPPNSGAPGWLVSALVMILLLAAGLGVVYFLLLPHTVADAKPAPTPAPAATGPAPTGGNGPLAKFIEVTGFRIITSSPSSKGDGAKKSEVQYLVVNHSDADISDANVFITLRSAKPGQAPLCRFSFKIPSLGPFEAKEMSSPIEKSARGISLPDWQDVRADVQISQ